MVNKYSPLLTDHFMNPRNIGRLTDYTFKVESDHLKDGDQIVFYVDLENGRVKDISYKIQG
ncbi:MAG: iron-sulfur cluster assembly scaffold protein, partial [Thermotogota bacterium]